MTDKEKALRYFKNLREQKVKDYSMVLDATPKGSVVYETVSAEIKIYDIAIKSLEQDVINRQAVEEFVKYIQTIKDKHNDENLPINYGTICDLVIRGWKLVESEEV